MLAPAGSSHRSAYTRTYVLPPSAPRRTQLLLYYAYRHVADARAEADAQAALCASLQLTGHILVAGDLMCIKQRQVTYSFSSTHGRS